MSSIKHAI